MRRVAKGIEGAKAPTVTAFLTALRRTPTEMEENSDDPHNSHGSNSQTKGKRRRVQDISSSKAKYLENKNFSDLEKANVSSSLDLENDAAGPAPPESEEKPISPQKTISESNLEGEQLEGDASAISSDEGITCLLATERILLLGTAVGSIHVLDIQGNKASFLPFGLPSDL